MRRNAVCTFSDLVLEGAARIMNGLVGMQKADTVWCGLVILTERLLHCMVMVTMQYPKVTRVNHRTLANDPAVAGIAMLSMQGVGQPGKHTMLSKHKADPSAVVVSLPVQLLCNIWLTPQQQLASGCKYTPQVAMLATALCTQWRKTHMHAYTWCENHLQPINCETKCELYRVTVEAAAATICMPQAAAIADEDAPHP
jgi:hypothetical protein